MTFEVARYVFAGGAAATILSTIPYISGELFGRDTLKILGVGLVQLSVMVMLIGLCGLLVLSV